MRFGHKQDRYTRHKTPTQLTLTLCKDWGRSVWIAEQRSMYGHVTHDLLGCIDIIALDPEPHPACIGIQATSRSNLASRVTKIKALDHDCAKLWTRSGNLLEVWGWKVKRVKVVENKIVREWRNDHSLTIVKMWWRDEEWHEDMIEHDQAALVEFKLQSIKWSKKEKTDGAG